MEDIYADIHDEVMRAKHLHPLWPTDPMHSVNKLHEEVGELAQAIADVIYKTDTIDHVREEAIQAAAMCIRFLDSIDRYVWEPSHGHLQHIRCKDMMGDEITEGMNVTSIVKKEPFLVATNTNGELTVGDGILLYTLKPDRHMTIVTEGV